MQIFKILKRLTKKLYTNLSNTEDFKMEVYVLVALIRHIHIMVVMSTNGMSSCNDKQ